MADDINISYSFQPSPTPPLPPTENSADSELIAFTGCDRVDLGNNGVLLLNRANGKQMTIAPEVATALTYCTTFKTLGQHAQTLVDTIPQLQGQLSDVTAVLTSVLEAGLMLHAHSICDQLKSDDTQPVAKLAPTRVCILTCDRPEAVERLLDSMLRAGNLSQHDEIFLVDDSRKTANSEQNLELAVKFNLTSSKSIRYVGANEQLDLLQQLVKSLPEHESSIRFLIDRERWADQKSYGLARTTCMLLTVGYRCIMLDDDILCSSVKPPSSQTGITFGGGSNRELTSYASEQELMQRASYNETDPLSGHASCLGMDLGHAIAKLGGKALTQDSLHSTNAAMLDTLTAESPILVTQCGSWGDPGTNGVNWFFHLGQESIARVLASPGGISDALENRYYWLGRTRPNISNMAVMSQATGLDNSKLLPPYFPVFRGEDYLFASMIVYIHPGSAVLDYDWCVPHLPLEQRGGRGAREPIAAQASLALYACYLTDRANFGTGAAPETRLQQLALLLKELSQEDADKLLATFRAELAARHADQLRLFSEQLKQAPALGSQAWEAYLGRGVEEVTRALQSPANPLDTPGLPGEITEETLFLQTKKIMAEFSASLLAWPEIRIAASTITSEMLESQAFNP